MEVGTNLGGTAVYSSKLLRRLGIQKSYIGYDTFGGFVRTQFERDVEQGTPEQYGEDFSSSSERLVRRILAMHGCSDVKLVKGDIADLPVDRLPRQISNALIDVDLSEPTYQALAKVFPRLSPGGVILVDDCDAQTGPTIWRAAVGTGGASRRQGSWSNTSSGWAVSARLLTRGARVAVPGPLVDTALPPGMLQSTKCLLSPSGHRGPEAIYGSQATSRSAV